MPRIPKIKPIRYLDLALYHDYQFCFAQIYDILQIYDIYKFTIYLSVVITSCNELSKTFISAHREKHDAFYQPNYVPDCFPTQYYFMEVFKYFLSFLASSLHFWNFKSFPSHLIRKQNIWEKGNRRTSCYWREYSSKLAEKISRLFR